MQFFLDDSDAIPIRLFSASNAPQRDRYAATPLAEPAAPLQRGARSVPGYPYIRFATDDDYDGSYPFDALQDLRTAYTDSSLSTIQQQMRRVRQQRAQAYLRRQLLEQQLRAFEQRERELLACQRQIEQQRREQAVRAAEQAKRAYAERMQEKRAADALQGFYPPARFFDRILSSRLQLQDDRERKQAHRGALEQLLNAYFAGQGEEPAAQAESATQAEPAALAEPAELDAVLRVVHDRLAEIGAQEDAEKRAGDDVSASPPPRASMDAVEEGEPAAKIARSSPPKQPGVSVEEPTDYARLAQALRARVRRLDDDDVVVPRSPDLEHSEADEADNSTKPDEDNKIDEANKPNEVEEPHSDSDFADMLGSCTSRLRSLRTGARKPRARRQRRHKHRAHRAKSKALEETILGAPAQPAPEVQASLDELQQIERELDGMRRDYSRRLGDTQLSFVADKGGNLRLAYTRGNAEFHAYQELLQRLLLRLDAVPSHGDERVRGRRRAIVRKVQAVVDALDRFAADQESEQSTEMSSE
ncbi:hypothetical protein H4S02_004131 [Coemansia sp. RSA 2611]|nr:hypothetical protein H4S02_004131 [Coemansia sp. RSA 2611]